MKKFCASILIFSAVLLGFVACDVAQPALSDEIVRYNSADNGYLVGSITFPKEKAGYNGYFIRVISLDPDPKVAKKNSKEIHISPAQIWKMKHDGQLDDGRTYLFALERPAGKYEISSVRLFTNSGVPGMQRTNYSGNFSIPFEVEKMTPTYVGNLLFNEFASANDTVVSYQNQYSRDIEAMKKLKPAIDWRKSTNDLNRKIEYRPNRVKP